MNPTNPYDTSQQLREQVAAQAAVIEALKESAQLAVEMIEYNKHERRHVRWKLNDAIALSNYTDSTRILDEVRKQERERVAQFVDDNCTYGDTHILVKAIRVME